MFLCGIFNNLGKFLTVDKVDIDTDWLTTNHKGQIKDAPTQDENPCYYKITSNGGIISSVFNFSGSNINYQGHLLKSLGDTYFRINQYSRELEYPHYYPRLNGKNLFITGRISNLLEKIPENSPIIFIIKDNRYAGLVKDLLEKNYPTVKVEIYNNSCLRSIFPFLKTPYYTRETIPLLNL